MLGGCKKEFPWENVSYLKTFLLIYSTYKHSQIVYVGIFPFNLKYEMPTILRFLIVLTKYVSI